MDSGHYVESMTNDVLYNILLNAEDDEMNHLCLTNQYAQRLCHNFDFWQHKMNHLQLDYFLQDQIASLKNYKRIFKTICQIKKRVDRLFQLVQQNETLKHKAYIDFMVSFSQVRDFLPEKITDYLLELRAWDKFVLFQHDITNNNVSLKYNNVTGFSTVLYSMTLSTAKYIFLKLFYDYPQIDIGLKFNV